MMMKVMLMKIVVCVSDEVLNSQHYKHSQSTEASDQYANTLQIIYLKTSLSHRPIIKKIITEVRTSIYLSISLPSDSTSNTHIFILFIICKCELVNDNCNWNASENSEDSHPYF